MLTSKIGAYLIAGQRGRRSLVCTGIGLADPLKLTELYIYVRLIPRLYSTYICGSWRGVYSLMVLY